MKGLMVTLLMLGLTGTVNAQQFGKDESAYGGSNSGRMPADQNNFRSTTGTGTEGQELFRIALPLDADVIEDLRQLGEKSAPISRPLETGEVIFGFAQPLEEAKDSDHYEPVKPVGQENGALIFEFTESQLKAVEKTTLRYRLPPGDIGKYDSVVVRVRRADFNNSINSPNPVDQFAGIRDQRSIQPPTQDRDWDNRGTASQLDPFDQRDRFPRTNVPTLDRNQPTSAPNRFASNDNSSTAFGMGALARDREPQTGDWRTDQQRRSFDDAPSFEASQLRIREQQLADKEQALLEEQQRLRRLQASSTDLSRASRPFTPYVSGNPSFASESAPYSASNTIPYSGTDNRYASNSLGMRPLDNGYSPNVNSHTDSGFQTLASTVLDGLNSLKQSNLDLSNRLLEIESQQRIHDSSVAANGPFSPTAAGTPDRFSRNYTPSMSGYQAQIKGMSLSEQDRAANQNMAGPIYFMLICSLGLNIYLGLISRNFYVRYNELADELRETFSASISN